ncbi:hypothetical protein AMAG_05109 [Allomyces macrogynus ATCC 38327]|uniref:PCI domain-containing protein n=1 Tax=Allomyces macrogynus (strain ATCC 38327) TaxID=578462 RepID=A0A0L0S799_ALLM3|nr:hypothetical protein AMAG_05109 [Allomyces macrogynus ATCC 38327]|eukprot:KNE58301.1 hypothetical protein AMAG_05109 [Allomyces macrogynus ATCC 38327]
MTVLKATFVNATDADLVLSYSAVVSKLHGDSSRDDGSEDTYLAEARTAVESGSTTDLVRGYCSEAGLILNVPETQVEGFFALLLALVNVTAAGNDKLEADLLGRIAKSIEDANVDKGVAKLKLLTHAFNAAAATSPVRLTLYTSIVKSAAKHGELKALAASVAHIPTWAAQWTVSTADVTTLLSLIDEKYLAAGLFEDAFTALVAHLNYLADAGKADKAAVESVLARAVLAGLAPPIKVLDLSPAFVSPAAAAVSGSATYKLLAAYVHGDLLGYKAVEKDLATLASKAAIKALPAPAALQASALAKVRQLYLTTLPLGTPVPLATLAKDMGVQDARDVEAVAISAVANGVIEGKLDGIQKTLTLTSAFKPHFTVADWERLLADLHAWKAGLVRVHKAIDALTMVDEFDDADVDDLDLGSGYDMADDGFEAPRAELGEDDDDMGVDE